MSTSFNFSEASAARMNNRHHQQQHALNKMSSSNLQVRPDDNASYSLLQSMVAASLQHQMNSNSCNNNHLLQSSPFDAHAQSKFLTSDASATTTTTGSSLANIFDEFPADAFEPVPIRARNALTPSLNIAPPSSLNANILESVLDHALGVVHEPDDHHHGMILQPPTPPPSSSSVVAGAVVSNVRKQPTPSADATTSSPQPQPKKRRIATTDNTNNQEPRFRGYQETQWLEQFGQLLKYKEQYGNCLVPHTFPDNQVLSRWVKRQRYQYKLKMTGKVSTMTDARIQKLEQVGFVWDSHATAWDKRLKELQEYCETYGNCNVPSNYPTNPELATWIKCQRRQYKLYWAGNKSSSMTVERMNALNKIGFIWKVREDLPIPAGVLAAHMF